ncbi:MAG: hypothetical protein U9R44_01995 [Candidatus Omnitrophota bacterium]|nr:hypothetical protein [Candidatus Omnitrophota bacterium]
MVLLIKIKKSPEQRFLVRLPEPELVDEVMNLIQGNRNSKAIVTALSKGNFLREVTEDEIHTLNVDVILTEKNAYHDLT